MQGVLSVTDHTRCQNQVSTCEEGHTKREIGVGSPSGGCSSWSNGHHEWGQTGKRTCLRSQLAPIVSEEESAVQRECC